MKDEEPNYFYARGERIELTPSEHYVAVDKRRIEADSADFPEPLMQQFEDSRRRVRRSVFLLLRSSLSDTDLEFLASWDAILPVFEAEGALTIVLPEVRVETESLEQRAAIDQLIDNSEPETRRKRSSKHGQVLEATDATAALRIANRAHEELQLPFAQARMLRVVPKR